LGKRLAWDPNIQFNSISNPVLNSGVVGQFEKLLLPERGAVDQGPSEDEDENNPEHQMFRSPALGKSAKDHEARHDKK
jgi:hypothetical protein